MANKSFGTNLTNDQNLSQTSAQLNQKEKVLIIERLIAILSENKLKPWFNVGLKDEYQKRYNQRLPEDWITIIKECAVDQIEVETLSLSNGTKTLIQLPIKSIKKQPMVGSNPPLKTVKQEINKVIPKSEQIKDEKPLIELNTKETKFVPKEPQNRRQMNSGGEQTKSATNGSIATNGVKGVTQLIDISNGAVVEDVIFGGKPIPSPILPQIKPMPIEAEDYFDLVVVLAATPSNFIVVPFKNVSEGSDFYDLKLKMYELYEKEENKIELPPEMIKKGLFVAAKSNNMWYRVEVISIMSEDPFQMIGFLCDFGEHKSFPLENIQPLYNCFRNLPMQAIRASLATIEPIGSDWDAIASYEFRKMVENKPFVATVYNIKIVDNNPVLSLSLCDTSGTDDLYVGPSLVKRDLAKPLVASI